MKPEYLLILEKTFDDPDLRPWLSLPNLLNVWGVLVAEFEHGYEWCISEYDNDMYVRWCIDRILNHPDIQTYPEIIQFRQSVDVIDNRFRKIASPHKRLERKEWWDQIILKYAGEAYVEDIWGIYDVKIDSVPESTVRKLP